MQDVSKQFNWHAHTLKANGHEMAWYEVGQGSVLLCLHGSYDHLLYRPMAELFAPKYRCVLYDQRGSGQSRLEVLNEDALHIDRFVEDIEALRNHLGLEQVSLLGHSWGCALGLLYSQAFPNRVSHLILAGPGPLDAEMSAFYHGNEERMMHPARWFWHAGDSGNVSLVYGYLPILIVNIR